LRQFEYTTHFFSVEQIEKSTYFTTVADGFIGLAPFTAASLPDNERVKADLNFVY
jgi:hypothetical protein